MSDYDQFLLLNTKPYSDQWVAMIDGTVIAHNKSFKQTYDQAKKTHPKTKPFFAKIPGNKAMIL
ncbi:MAG: hypothetical protein GOV15_03135 [Candidatus Diapherotrites archaeon]|nr:hypothetical protein [Candidatus Diapherotrites archaeon]